MYEAEQGPAFNKWVYVVLYGLVVLVLLGIVLLRFLYRNFTMS
jgi:uncharacterized membrane-anchored protein YhcB (DUF1043 family)